MTTTETRTAILIRDYSPEQQFALLSLGCWWPTHDGATLVMPKGDGRRQTNELAVRRYITTQTGR